MITVEGRGKTGTVLLRDTRPDGSYVLLECQEFTPTGGGGVLVLPESEEFPTISSADLEKKTRMYAERVNKEPPFSLEVDISAMPAGALRFTNRAFIEKAVEESEVAKKTEISPGNAEAWGYIGAPAEAG
jgi:hypothetical protein